MSNKISDKGHRFTRFESDKSESIFDKIDERKQLREIVHMYLSKLELLSDKERVLLTEVMEAFKYPPRIVVKDDRYRPLFPDIRRPGEVVPETDKGPAVELGPHFNPDA